MRRVKQTSIAKYISNWFSVSMVVFFFIMFVIVMALSRVAMEYDVQRQIGQGIRRNIAEVRVRDGKLHVKKQFREKEDGSYYLILSPDGEILYGQYPPGFELKCPTEPEKMTRKVRNPKDGKDYYVRDIYRRHKDLVFRCVVKTSDIDSQYKTIRRALYALFPLMIFLVMILRQILERKIAGPVQDICSKVNEIGEGKKISNRIDYQGQFQELAVFAEASNHMLDQLEAMFENQKQFTSNVAHELRTPVAVVMAQCEDARAYAENMEEYREAQEVIERQAHKMNHIITQMLNLSRLEQNRVRLNLECVELGEIVDAVCEDEQLLKDKEIEVKVKVGPEKVNVDICLMTILVHNLVENAVKYSEPHTLIRVWSEAREGWLHLYVQDQGCGISEENLKRITQRFYRVEGTADQEGFGLGLSVATQIADKHGGRIEVSSVLGIGSTFQLILPQAGDTNGEI